TEILVEAEPRLEKGILDDVRGLDATPKAAVDPKREHAPEARALALEERTDRRSVAASRAFEKLRCRGIVHGCSCLALGDHTESSCLLESGGRERARPEGRRSRRRRRGPPRMGTPAAGRSATR